MCETQGRNGLDLAYEYTYLVRSPSCMFRLKNSITLDLKKKKKTRLQEMEIHIQILILDGTLPDMYLLDNLFNERRKGKLQAN